MDGISGKQGNGEAYGTVVSHGVAFGGGMRGIGAGTGDIEKTLRIRERNREEQPMNRVEFAGVWKIATMNENEIMKRKKKKKKQQKKTGLIIE